MWFRQVVCPYFWIRRAMAPRQKYKSAKQLQKERNRPSRHERLGLPKPPPKARRQQLDLEPSPTPKRTRQSGILDRRVDLSLTIDLTKGHEDDWMDDGMPQPSTCQQNHRLLLRLRRLRRLGCHMISCCPRHHLHLPLRSHLLLRPPGRGDHGCRGFGFTV